MAGRALHDITRLWCIIGRHLSGSFFVRSETEILTLEPHPHIPSEEEAFLAEEPWRDGIYPPTPDAKFDANGRRIGLERIGECLRRSKLILPFLSDDSGPAFLDSRTMVAISCPYETLGGCTDYVFHGETRKQYEKAFSPVLSSTAWASDRRFCRYILDSMTRLRWCPHTINTFSMDSYRTLVSDYFAINTKSPQSDEDHSIYTMEMCLTYQLDKRDYSRIHFDVETRGCLGSKCCNLRVDPDISGAVLVAKENFPLVQVSLPDDSADVQPTVDILDSAPEEVSVAISPVWSHGLGNPHENSLPACQLFRIQRLVNAICKDDVGDSTETTIPSWLDSLCIPREPKEMPKKRVPIKMPNKCSSLIRTSAP